MRMLRKPNQQKKQKIIMLSSILLIVLVILGVFIFGDFAKKSVVPLTSNTTISMTTPSTTTQKDTQTSELSKNGQETTMQSVSQESVKESSAKNEEAAISQGATSESRTNTSEIKRIKGVIIVNKKYGLPKDYNPGENATAKQAFLNLKQAMQQKGFAVSDQYSGFRSYDYQEQVYNNYVRSDGQANADRYSARPGYSEHQTGLAFDFIDTTGQLLGEGIQDGATDWLAQHAHEYGFIVRYLPGKESITGYMAETWHVRYVGELAEEIYRSGLTLEEFFGVEGGDYAN